MKKKQVIKSPSLPQKPDLKKRNTNYSNFIWLGGILLLTLISYLPVFKNGFTNFDDPVYVLENPYIYGLTWANLTHIFTDFYYGGYYPLTLFSFAIDFSLGGMDPFIFHFTNILLHLCNTALVFWLIHKLFSNLSVSIVTALLFGIHPLHVESVAWISERKDVLYAFFFLLSLLSYLLYTDKKNRNFYALSLFLFLLSVLSKTTAVSLFFCLILLDWFRERDLKNRTLILEKIPFLIIALVFGIINILSQKSIGAIDASLTYPIFQRLIFACYAFSMYIFRLFVPADLSAIYPYPFPPGESLPAYLFLFLIPLAATLFFIIKFLYKYKAYSFALLFFIVNIILVLQLIQINDFVRADRFVYVASIGFFLFIAFLVKDILHKYSTNKNTLYIAVALYSIFLIYTTNTYSKTWKDSISLWDNVLEKHPDVYRALDKRGQAKSDAGLYKEALLDFNQSIEINPDYYAVYINRGFAFNMLGQNEKALEDYEKAIHLNPEDYMAYNNRGTTRANMGDLEGAVADFSEAIRLNPLHVKAYTNRGLAYMSLNEMDKAMIDYNKAINLNPEYFPTYNFRGLAFAKNEKLNEALTDFDKCLALYPDYPEALFNRGVIRLQLNQKASGCEDLSKAATLGHPKAVPMMKLYCN